MNGVHAHLCDPANGGCSALWIHGDENQGKTEEHTCPSCGKMVWKKVIAHSNARKPQPNNAQAIKHQNQPAALTVNVIDFDDLVRRATDAVLLMSLFVIAYHVGTMIVDIFRDMAEGEASQ